MTYVIATLVGFIAGIFLCFGTDDWRIQKFTAKGYDTAVKHILEYGYYYNPDGDRINIPYKKNEEIENDSIDRHYKFTDK